MQPVLQQPKPMTSMESLQLAGQVAKADNGRIRSISSKDTQVNEAFL